MSWLGLEWALNKQSVCSWLWAIKMNECLFYQRLEFFIVYVDDRMFLFVWLLKTKDIQLIMLVSTFGKMMIAPMNSHNMLRFTIIEDVGLSYAKATTKPIPAAR